MLWKSRFKTKAIAGFGGMAAATIVVAVVAIGQARRSADDVTRAARAEARELLLTQQLRFRLERIVADGQGYLLFGEQELLSRLRESWSQVQTTLQTMDEEISSRAARTHLRKVTQTAGAYRHIVEQAVTEREASHDLAALQRFEQRLRLHREDLDASVTQLWNEEIRSFEEGLGAADRSSKRAELLIFVTAIAALMLSLVIARVVVRELARLYDREEQSARRAQAALAARDELLAIIAHDLRSPLTAILMKAGLIRRKAEPTPTGTDLRGQAESIEGTARRMEHLIKSLLDAATIEAGRFSMAPASCDVQDLLRATFEMFEPLAAQKSIHLDLKRPTNTLNVWADRDRVLQVFSNLVANAIKFTPEGGTITLRAEPASSEVRFAVTDTGVGIREDQRSNVFERYWRAERGGRLGTGLGLYIARGIVEAGRGRIWFESHMNEGTTFFFSLPSSDETPEHSSRHSADQNFTSTGLGHG